MVAENAEEAARAVADHHVDLILLDLVLPDADGRDFLLGLRERRATAETPVIVLSARPADQAAAECMALGAQEYLEKPVNPARTVQAVDRQLEKLKVTRAEASTPGPRGLVNRAEFASAFGAAREEAASSEPGSTLAMACIDAYRPGGHSAHERPMEGRPKTESAIARVLGVLRPPDLIMVEPTGRLVALFPQTTPEDAKDLLAPALLTSNRSPLQERSDVDSLVDELAAGIAEVSRRPNLAEAIARADRLLSLARSPGMPRIVTSATDARPSRKEILVVEDDPVAARLLTHRLSRDGFEVTHFDDGRDAYEAVVGGLSVSLAILDGKLPGMDGFELLQRVRELERFREVPVIMLTSMGRESDIVRGFDLGANDYVLKPFSPVELVARIHRLLEG
jgi:DNA-binding response OmpR family regulator